MTFVAMGFNPPVRWMTEEEIYSYPMKDSFMSIRGPYPKRFVDFNEETDMWWYGEKHSDSKISWYRVIVVVNREYQHDRQTDDPGEQES
jgi:hypothetical protein